jgi:AraC-like DNA-binding protein
VKSRLDRVKDWPAVARQAHFQLRQLALMLKASERNIRRYIWKRFKKRKKRATQWLDELRAADAERELKRGESGKAAAAAAHYAHQSSFARSFKRLTGSTAGNYSLNLAMSGIAKESPEKLNNVRFS